MRAIPRALTFCCFQMGLWSILEEESLFPKATDKSFEEKLRATLGKLSIFLKPQSKTDKHAHFAINHYAGVVSYNVAGWLEKNKDPVNDSVVELFKSSSSCQLLVNLWADHPGQPTNVPKEDGKKKKKAGGGKTVSSVYLVSLGELMTTLYSCEPHFVRCIVPNTHKKPGDVEPPLIMHQLTCNGVLEGIRICMRGFPNRVPYNGTTHYTFPVSLCLKSCFKTFAPATGSLQSKRSTVQKTTRLRSMP